MRYYFEIVFNEWAKSYICPQILEKYNGIPTVTAHWWVCPTWKPDGGSIDKLIRTNIKNEKGKRLFS